MNATWLSMAGLGVGSVLNLNVAEADEEIRRITGAVTRHRTDPPREHDVVDHPDRGSAV